MAEAIFGAIWELDIHSAYSSIYSTFLGPGLFSNI